MVRCSVVPPCASLCLLIIGGLSGLLSGAGPEQLVVASNATESVCCNENSSCGRCCVPDQMPASSPTGFPRRRLAERVSVRRASPWTPEEDGRLAQMTTSPSSSVVKAQWPLRTVLAVQKRWLQVRASGCFAPCTPHPTLPHSEHGSSIAVTVWGEPQWGPQVDWMRDVCGHTNGNGPYKWTPASRPGMRGAWVRAGVRAGVQARQAAASGELPARNVYTFISYGFGLDRAP